MRYALYFLDHISRNIAMYRFTIRIVFVLGLLFAFVGHAEAHPLGNFTINQYSRVVVGSAAVTVHYVVDMAEIPAFQAIQSLDTNQDGQMSETERQAFIDDQSTRLSAGLKLTVDGTILPLHMISRDLSFPPGQGGLNTLRLVFDLEAARPTTSTRVALYYHVENFNERLGWREIVVQSIDGLTLAETTAPTATVSDELRNYPQDALSSPLNMREVQVAVAPDGAAALPTIVQSTSVTAIGRADDRLAALIAGKDLSTGAIMLALLLAFVLGAGHALTPGHGKTVVAAYLIGARGTARQALFLGLTTTLTHTAGVFLLGIITLAISKYLLPEQIYPWLEFTSGALVVVIGIALFRSRLLALIGWQKSHTPVHDQLDHAPEHEHGAHTHSHDWLNHEHGPHTHTHEHDGVLADWADSKISGNSAARPAVTWRSLLALGVSGGLIPCPSALVVLLGAIALGRVGFGLLLILAFSTGLAAVLTALGMLLVYARSFFERLPTSSLFMRALPVASAVLVTLAGCIICLGGLVQAGIL